MRSLQTFVCALAVIALAACGGGGSLPATTNTGTGPSAFEPGTIWVVRTGEVAAYPVNGSGMVNAEAALQFPWPGVALSEPGVTDVAVAPDGTPWVLLRYDIVVANPSGWQLYGAAPGGSAPQSTAGANSGEAFGLAIGRDGVMVGMYDLAPGSNGPRVTSIATYPFAANTKASEIRRFVDSGTMSGFATNSAGDIYVSRPDRIDVYASTSTGCCPIRTIMTATPPVGRFKVGPDNSIYGADLSGSRSTTTFYVDVYPPGSGQVGRRIGPIPAFFQGFGSPQIAVDAKNRVYVATSQQIFRFAAGANGTDAPENVFSVSPGDAFAVAIGPKL